MTENRMIHGFPHPYRFPNGRSSDQEASSIEEETYRLFGTRRSAVFCLFFVLVSSFSGTLLAQQADLAVFIDDGRGFFVPGNPVAYGVTVINQGPDKVTGLALSLNLDSEVLNPVSAPGIGAFNSQTGLWSGLCLGVGGVASLVVSGTIANPAGQNLVSSVHVAPADGNVDPNSSDNVDEDIDFQIAIFNDGFESGGTSLWSDEEP